MNVGSVIAWIFGVLVAVIVLVGVWVVLKAVFLVLSRSSFSAWVMVPGSMKWRSGVARYGRSNLAWFRLYDFSAKPRFVLPRTHLDVDGAPFKTNDSAHLIVELRAPDGLYFFALSPGNAAGLVSWASSAPPGE